jgi:hypothetical protein
VASYQPRHAAAGRGSGKQWWWASALGLVAVALVGILLAVTGSDDGTPAVADSVAGDTVPDGQASAAADDAAGPDGRPDGEEDGEGGDDRQDRDEDRGREPAGEEDPALGEPADATDDAEEDPDGAPAIIGPVPTVEATATFGGDVLIHGMVADTARTGDGYDFSPMLDPIAPLLQGSDLAICHLEVTLGREGEQPTGYPVFRSPPQLAVDLAEAGFDGCSIASNHALDYGETGVYATLDGMDAAGLQHTGTARSQEERDAPVFYDAAGLRIAHLSYSYGFNGFTRPEGKDWIANPIEPEQILADAAVARDAGADAVVASLHWGTEYRHDIQPEQMAVAEVLAAEPGAVDLVIGHHAHVVQPVSKVGDMWVVWGLGNMLSNNATSCCPVTTADGLLVTAEFSGTPGHGAEVSGVRVTPTWNERTTFRVLPAAATLAAPDVPPELAADLRASFERTIDTVLSEGGADLGVAPDLEPPPG